MVGSVNGSGSGKGQNVSTIRRGKPFTMAAIPAYNEAANIASVVERTRQYVDIVVVIDDGSRDRTSELAKRAGADVVRHSENRGKAGGIMSAIEVASRRDVDYLVLLDGDGQHDPDDIPRLLEPLANGEGDIVIGSRFLDIRNPIPFYRTIGQRVLNVATHAGSGLRCSDSQCGFRALNRIAYSALALRETFLHGLAVESEMQFQAADAGLRLCEVPIFVSYDEKARRSPIKHGFGVLYRVFALTGRRLNPRLRRTTPVRLEPESQAAD
jgi:glycosyltransferase involved in cell wall biosynthesis